MKQFLVLFVAGMLMFGSTTFAFAQKLSNKEFKFSELDRKTQQKLDEFKAQAAQFKEGCRAESSDKVWAIINEIKGDSACGVAATAAFRTRNPITVAGAVLACGVEVPSAVRKRIKDGAKLKECKEITAMVDQYKQHCQGKELWLFAYGDVLYCYTVDDDLFLLTIDLERRTATFRAAKDAK